MNIILDSSYPRYIWTGNPQIHPLQMRSGVGRL